MSDSSDTPERREPDLPDDAEEVEDLEVLAETEGAARLPVESTLAGADAERAGPWVSWFA